MFYEKGGLLKMFKENIYAQLNHSSESPKRIVLSADAIYQHLAAMLSYN